MATTTKPTGTIRNIQGLSIQGSSDTSNKIDLSVIEGRVRRILASNTLGIRQTATIDNLEQVKAGTVLFRVPELLKTKAYNKDSNEADKPNVGMVSVDLNVERTVIYELETFDINSISNWDEIHTQIALGAATSIKAELDLVLLKHLYKSSKQIVLANAYSQTPEEIQKTRLTLSLEQTDLADTMTKTMIGTQGKETIGVLSSKGYTLMLNGLSTVGGDKAIDMKISGEIEGNLINGNAITKHVFIGKDVETTLFSDIPKDKLSNFTNVFALMWHKESVAFPVNILQVVQAISPKTGNPIFITKYKYGIDTIRPQLIKSIVLAKNEDAKPAKTTKAAKAPEAVEAVEAVEGASAS